MLLSIVIPTLNRSKLLEETLLVIEREVKLLAVAQRTHLEVVVIDNASTDSTADLIGQWQSPFFRYVRHSECVPVGKSIARAIGEAQSEFVWVVGDDDFFSPGLLCALMCWIAESPHITLFYFNRAILDWTFCHHIRVAHARWETLFAELPMSEFIRRYSHWPGFVTAMVFRRQAYLDGLPFDRPEFEAWEFLARIYFGGRYGMVRILNFPVVGQRLGVHSWKANWPRYWLINMPRLLSELEGHGVTTRAVHQWRTDEISAKRLLVDTLVAKAFGVDCRSTFWKEARDYQPSWRGWILIVNQWLLPCKVAKLLYKLQPKYRK